MSELKWHQFLSLWTKCGILLVGLVFETLCQAHLVSSGTIEQGDCKRTIDHYFIIYEHTKLVAGVFLCEELKTCPTMFQNRTKMT